MSKKTVSTKFPSNGITGEIYKKKKRGGGKFLGELQHLQNFGSRKSLGGTDWGDIIRCTAAKITTLNRGQRHESGGLKRGGGEKTVIPTILRKGGGKIQ